ncbi:MAG: MarC family protein [Bdellovibrionales bacterium]|nr:MarC family protein [Bdellovibrionales bacterium]
MLRSLVNDFITLFVVIDPIGIVPLFLGLTRHLTRAQRRKVAGRGVMIASVILFTFVFGGGFLLGAIGVSMESFKIAGGVILFLFGLQMVFENEKPAQPSEAGYDPAVYPVASPSIAGPGAMLAVTAVAQAPHYGAAAKPITAALLAGVLLLTWLALSFANGILNWIGRTGANAVSRVLGVLLCGVAVEFVVGAVRSLLGAA